MTKSASHSASTAAGSCLVCVLFVVPSGFIGLWIGSGIGSLMSPENEELVLGYLGTSEEWSGAMIGGLLGAFAGIGLFKLARNRWRWL